jgi:mRNA interferase MazF
LTGEVPRRGDIWLADLDKRRPVVVMHRDFAGQRLSAVLAAPLTSTLRAIPTAVRLGSADGLDRECIASLDNLTLVAKADLHSRIGRLGPDRLTELCRALAIALDCGDRW